MPAEHIGGEPISPRGSNPVRKMAFRRGAKFPPPSASQNVARKAQTTAALKNDWLNAPACRSVPSTNRQSNNPIGEYVPAS
ncbi:hypothetical protein NXT3_CH00597 [Sinorhizobium fredii]|uniref:Uncharacterized protein n=1 Tax=Rhizobium fredii TaxID=380 RepID=A0A2L0H172_RHIFR|nr:hypothetical protein NXT3_CH00597 [Sinorhizobium fredii]